MYGTNHFCKEARMREGCPEFMLEVTSTAKLATVHYDGRPHAAPDELLVRVKVKEIAAATDMAG